MRAVGAASGTGDAARDWYADLECACDCCNNWRLDFGFFLVLPPPFFFLPLLLRPSLTARMAAAVANAVCDTGTTAAAAALVEGAPWIARAVCALVGREGAADDVAELLAVATVTARAACVCACTGACVGDGFVDDDAVADAMVLAASAVVARVSDVVRRTPHRAPDESERFRGGEATA